MLTNWDTVKTRIARLKTLEEQEQNKTLDSLPKKEAANLRKELEKLQKHLGGLKDMPGIGISFGLDRIYLVMEELGLFPDLEDNLSQVLFVNFGHSEADFCLQSLTQIRRAGINAELYPDSSKLKKQMNYAHKKNIPFVVLVGEDEVALNLLTVKNMNNGSQSRYSVTELISLIHAQ